MKCRSKQILILFVIWLSHLSAYDEYISKEPFLKETPADISFFVVDLKYNKHQGVKVCEMQRGIISSFTGFDYLYGPSLTMGLQFVQFVSRYQKTGWYDSLSVQEQGFRKSLRESNWIEHRLFASIKEDSSFISKKGINPNNPQSLTDYSGVVWTTCMNPELLEELRSQWPGILFIDSVSYLFLESKALMYDAFSSSETLKQLKPRSKTYKKRYTKSLAKEILNDIPGDIVVIKPLKGSKGQGIIITKASDLDKTLKLILSKKSKKKLIKNPDSSYNHWALDSNDSFAVEEFIQSDSVTIPHLQNKSYDATMRVACCMVYDNQTIEVHFLGSYWKLPKKSVSDKGTLNDIHKSFANEPFFSKVAPDVYEEVQAQLSEALVLIYQRMLDFE